MPGIIVVFGKNTLSRSDILSGYNDLKYTSSYEVTEYYSDTNIAVAFSGYNGYPVQKYEDQNILFLCEGLIYTRTRSEIEDRIRGLADDYMEKRDFKQRIIDFIDSSDGDYLVLVYFKRTGELLVFNDRWGRLPTFYSIQGDLCVLSREMKFILNCIPVIEFDRFAMGEFLMFEYNLGSKTFFKNVRRLEPASLLQRTGSADNYEVSCEELLPTSFDTQDRGLTREEAVKKCAQLYWDSIEARVCKLKEVGLDVVADLSGGYDTRAVFFGLCNTGVDFICCTEVMIVDETGVTQQLCDLCNKKLLKFEGKTLSCSEDVPMMHHAVYLTDGLVNCFTTMICYQKSLEKEKKINYPYARFMGFGGEYIRHPYYTKLPGCEVSEMLADNFYTRYIDSKDATAMVRLKNADFRNHLAIEAAKFPEKNTQDKIKHFYFDYYNKLVNGGENRHRLFTWTVQPLWGKELFQFEMQCIPRKWISYGFFIDFLKEINPKSLEVSIYGSRLNLKSKLDISLHEFKGKLRNLVVDNPYGLKFKRWLFYKINAVRRNSVEYRAIKEEILNAFDKSEVVCSHFDRQAVRLYLSTSPSLSQLYQLLTVMVYLEEVEKRFSDKIRLQEEHG